MALPDFLFLSSIDGAPVSGTDGALVFDTSATGAGAAGTHNMSTGIALQGGTGTRCNIAFDISGGAYADGWISFMLNGMGTGLGSVPIVTLSGPTADLFRFNTNGTLGHWDVQYWNGSAWTTIGATITSPIVDDTGPCFRVDIRFILDNSAGEFSVYIDGALSRQLIATDTIFTADTTIDVIRFETNNSSSAHNLVVAAIIADSVDTRTLFIDEQIALGNGGETAFTGGETAIDQTIHSTAGDAAPNVATTAGQRETYTWNSVTSAYDSYAVEGVILAARARAVTDPGLYLRGIVRTGGVNYAGDNSVQPAAGAFKPNNRMRFVNNPVTAAPWASVATVNSYEWGMEARSAP